MRKILIIDKFSIIRLGLLQLFREAFKGTEIDEANSSEQVFDLFDKNSVYDLVILCESLPGVETNQMIRKIRQFNPTGSVLIFSDIFSYPEAINYFINGASGYLTKSAENIEIEAAIRLQLNHEPYISKEMMEAIAKEKLSSINGTATVSQKITRTQSRSSEGRLSRRQNEIVNHLILGESTTDIARVLNLKLSTVSTHKSKIYLKLGVSNVVALKNLLEKKDA